MSNSGLDITASYGLDMRPLEAGFKRAEQLAQQSATRLDAILRPSFGATRAGGSQQIPPTQAITRAQQQQAAAAHRLDQLNEQLRKSQLGLSLAQNTGAARVRVLTQDYERLQVRTREAGLAQDELTRRQIAATQAATRLQREQAALGRTQTAALPRTFAGFTAGGALQAAGAVGIATGVSALTQQLANLGQESNALANQAQRIGTAYEQSTKKAGVNADGLLQKLKEVTRGTVTEADLQLRANQALGLNVGQNVQQIADLFTIARVRGKQFGVDTAEALERIILGLGKAEPELLDELGILTDANKAYKDYASSIGVSVDSLTKKQKVQILVNDVIARNRDLLIEAGNAALDNADKQIAAQVRIQEAKTRFGVQIAPLYTAGLDLVGGMAQTLTGGNPLLNGEGVQALLRNLAQVSQSFDEFQKKRQEFINSSIVSPDAGTAVAGLAAALTNVTETEYERLRAVEQLSAAEAKTAREEAARSGQIDQTARITNAATAAANAYAAVLNALPVNNAKAALASAEANVDALSEAMARQSLAIRQAEAALRPYERAVEAAGDAVSDQRDAIERAEAALEPYRQAAEAAGDAVKRQQAAIDAAERSLRPFQSAVDTASEAVDAQRTVLAAAEAQLKPYTDAIEDAQRAIDEQNRKIEVAERALRPYEQAVRDSEQAVSDQERALREAEKGLAGYRDAVDAAARAVDDQERALAAAEKALKPYHDAVRSAEDAVAAQQKRIAEAERSLRPFEDALKRAERAEQDQQRAIDTATKSLRPWQEAVTEAEKRVSDQEAAIRRAERALRPYQQAVASSQAQIDKHKKSVDDSRASLDKQSTALDDARQRQTEWANTPLEGSRAFSDQLFAIDQQTAEIQRKLLDLRIGKKSTAPSPLEMELSRVNDQVQATALRLAGLRENGGPKADIGAAEAAYQALRGRQDTLSTRLATTQPVDDPEIKALEQQLEDLGIEAERVRLDEKLKIDPLRRQLEQLGKPLNELNFEDIIAGFQRSTDEVNALTPQVAAAQAAWEREQTALDASTVAHERNVAALEAQEAAIEPMREVLQGYQDGLEQANLALTAQEAAIEPLRLELERLQEVTQGHRDALERQQEAIQPLRDELEGLQGNMENARTSFENADRALDPLRDHLDELKGSLDTAKVALDEADRALDPMREHLNELQGAAGRANDELARQQELIRPLRDALVPLEDALSDANQAYKDQNDLLDPLREKLMLLEDNLERARAALSEQEKAIKPLRDRLVELREAQSRASDALDDANKRIDPMREKLKLLERSYRDAQTALDDQREPIRRAQERLDDLGLKHDGARLKVDELKKELGRLSEQLALTAGDAATQNDKLARNFTDTYGIDDQTGIRGIVGNASDRMLEVTQNAWGTNATTGMWGATGTATNGILGLVQGLSNQLIGENGLIPGISTGGSSGFGDLSTSSVGHMAAMTSAEPTGILGLIQGLSDGLIGEGGLIPKIRDDGSSGFGDMKDQALGHISGLVGDWDAKTGALGRLYGLWDTLTQKSDTLKNALLNPFKGAELVIGGVMEGFGDELLRPLNRILNKIGEFALGVAKAVNWISGHIIGSDVLPTDFEAPQIPLFNAPGLAVGTKNWRGGWARTGEEGRELALLPKGSRLGNATYLPPGAAVLPSAPTERILRTLPGFATGLNTDLFAKDTGTPTPKTGKTKSLWDFIPPEIKRVVDLIQNGKLGISQGIEALGLPSSPGLSGTFASFNESIRRNLLGFGIHAAYNVISDWLRSVLPAVLSGPIIRGMQGGGTSWQPYGNTPAPELPRTPEAPPQPTSRSTGNVIQDALARLGLQGGVFTQGYRADHEGLDIAGLPYGRIVRAFFPGRITTSRFHPTYGNQIVTVGSQGNAYYGHLAERIAAGSVGIGDVIGLLGNTGTAVSPRPTPQNPTAGTHLHLQLSGPGGGWEDPMQVFRRTLAYKNGGMINEPVWGMGASGRSYVFGDGKSPELVIPMDRLAASLDRRRDPMDRLGNMERVQPIIVEERRYQIDAHYATYQSEGSLVKDIWRTQQLDPRG